MGWLFRSGRKTAIDKDKNCTDGLREKQKFSLHYDFGDDWMFTINVQNIQEDIGKTEPYIVKSKGSIEQYPDWDDEWE